MPRVLVLALENWLGAARLPKALRTAGFDVNLLCYPNTLISLTKYAGDRDLCLPSDDAETVAERVIALLDGVRFIIPADDRAVRFLQHIVEVTPLGRLPEVLTGAAARSLPAPEAFKYGEDKEAATELMEHIGFSTPKREVVWSRGDLRAFAAEVGFPIIIKPLSGTAGQGIQVLRTEDDIAVAEMDPKATWFAQQYITGVSAACASVALEGKCVATIAYEKTLTYPGETGPATLVTRIESEPLHRGSVAYAKATGFNGFFSLGYMLERETRIPYFLECNARVVPLVAVSDKIGLDLCRALYCKMVGAPVPTLDADAPTQIALYPQELHRDPESPNREHILDEPIDDPAMHAAMERGIKLLAQERG